MPVMPKDFDRKYIMFKGGRNGDGSFGSEGPVQVTQPKIDFNQYSLEETNILLQIISGIMSPATLGIDIAKKDNGVAQREKEKVTIFTRNVIINEEVKIYKMLANDLLVAWELMHKGEITCKKYDVSVEYSEFADASYESKLETVLMGWQAGLLSDERAVRMVHGSTLSDKALEKEVEFVKSEKEKAQNMGNAPENQGLFGDLGAENEYNDAHEHPEKGDMLENLV